jgi:hypothetical protein
MTLTSSGKQPNIHSIAGIQSVSAGTDTPPQAPALPRAGTTVSVAGEYSKGLLFMKLCIVCAYPSTPVLSGVWRTCGSIRGVLASLQMKAIQRETFGVDNNLFGVSGQVTAPGVLAFSQIFAALRAGKGACAAAALK